MRDLGFTHVVDGGGLSELVAAGAPVSPWLGPARLAILSVRTVPDTTSNSCSCAPRPTCSATSPTSSRGGTSAPTTVADRSTDFAPDTT